MAAREPVFNFSEKEPVQFAALLIACFVVLRYTPLAVSPEVGNVVVLRPAALTDGLGWLSAGAHAFFHNGWTHLLMNCAMMVVFAILVMRGARAMGVRRGRQGRPVLVFVAIFLLSVFGGAFAQWAWWAVADVLNGPALLEESAVGASGGISGLFAAGAYAMGGRETVLKFGLGWALINAMMVFAESLLGFGIAWAAHLGGYLAGAIFAPLWVAANSTVFDPRR